MHDSLKFVTECGKAVFRCVAVGNAHFVVCNGLVRFLSPVGCDSMYRTMVRKYLGFGATVITSNLWILYYYDGNCHNGRRA
jgi:hypothetical protein